MCVDFVSSWNLLGCCCWFVGWYDRWKGWWNNYTYNPVEYLASFSDKSERCGVVRWGVVRLSEVRWGVVWLVVVWFDEVRIHNTKYNMYFSRPKGDEMPKNYATSWIQGRGSPVSIPNQRFCRCIFWQLVSQSISITLYSLSDWSECELMPNIKSTTYPFTE